MIECVTVSNMVKVLNFNSIFNASPLYTLSYHIYFIIKSEPILYLDYLSNGSFTANIVNLLIFTRVCSRIVSVK